jgi:hypothetical protein
MTGLSTEEKIKLLSIALKATDLYNIRVYKLHQYCFALLNEITLGKAKCVDKESSVRKLEDLMDGFQKMIYKYENYRQVMSQIKFN